VTDAHDNPLRAGLRAHATPEASVMVIFGATGDLARRKLFPALYRLYDGGLLASGFGIVGVGRRSWGDDEFRADIRTSLDEFLGEPLSAESWEGFAQRLFFSAGQFDDPVTYAHLLEVLQRVDAERVHTGNRLFYLAVQPTVVDEVVEGLGRGALAGTRADRGWARIVIEKPFGRDCASALELNDHLREWFREDQIYRMDHYLGKETVQNILVFRLANVIFEPVWNQQYVDHVQITVAEDLGIEDRGAYYEEAGAMRDIIQNHVLQLVCLVAMEPPATFAPEAVRDEKVKVLRALRPISGVAVDRDVVRGQYVAGYVHGTPVVGYRQEAEVAPDSRTETYVAMRVFVDTWRWAGVPFYLRTGKRLAKRVTEIAIQFKRPPLAIFGAEAASELEPNVLTMHIQPDEGITLRFGGKVPGPGEHIHSVTMDFRYGTSFGGRTSDAYERLLLDSLQGDSTLFTRDDGVEAAWRFVDTIVARWLEPGSSGPYPYTSGSFGPAEAQALIEADGREWRLL
jgi:glucose-6-phosphate 1-dehydrogenase